ncbi:ABC transporter ATP-binding protein [Thermoflavimicrobium daqui]|jgi:putative ABC transport system ATP-binding protein|uniref:Lipoprotein-releasing system ATP-binding protein LolD n=1 Tax=Thermoflavimicrobium daqui TaxID=2137476 RepID=A0A364K5M2_9BACL|nr:ABC transporter ATP-binding protein [Thermoflavimicrobium daqui]RAL24559.1 lipoprotein-releasing system ATP-binding protein LolD [Thermoflavimicrobium daqui]
MNAVIQTISLNKTYGKGINQFHALKDIQLSIYEGEFVAIMGTSGSGKSTLLHLLSGLDQPTTGEVLFNGKALHRLNDSQLTELRRDQIGFIFQFFHLIPVLSAEENVTLPAMLAGKTNQQLTVKARQLLQFMGIGQLAKSLPSQMSGGQQQRVAIARSLINDPKLILADEPTGSLDSKTSKEILTILQRFCAERNHSLAMVTHDPHVAAYADRVIFLQDGRIVYEHTFTSDHPQANASFLMKVVEEIGGSIS